MGLSWWGRCYVFCPISARSCLTLPDKQKLRLKSPVLKKQACPQWKHSFVFNNLTTSQLSQSSLELTVWDQATFGLNDRLLGGARLGSSKSCASREVGWWWLVDRSHPRLLWQVTWLAWEPPASYPWCRRGFKLHIVRL